MPIFEKEEVQLYSSSPSLRMEKYDFLLYNCERNSLINLSPQMISFGKTVKK